MSDTDGGKSGSDYDDETYGSKKRKTKQKVNYITFFNDNIIQCKKYSLLITLYDI